MKTLKDLGITAEQAADWQALAEIPEEEFQRRLVALKGDDPLDDIHALILDTLTPEIINSITKVNGHLASYRPRSIAGRRRRSAADLDELLRIVGEILGQQTGPISIRHLFYLTVSAGAVEKTERGYKNLTHQLGKWRRSGDIDWSAFADSTRWYYGRTGSTSPEAHLEEAIRTYRYDLWESHPHHVEIWCEKDAIASILHEAADPWRVQVLPLRGYASLSSLYSAAETFRDKQDEGKHVHVYYFGDHDPSGRDIDRSAITSLREDFEVDVDYQRVAVTEEQIAAYNLPTRPTKATDTRARHFEGESVEIDAMPRDTLLELVEQCITQHLPDDALARLRATEREQRTSLQAFLKSWTRRRKGRPT